MHKLLSNETQLLHCLHSAVPFTKYIIYKRCLQFISPLPSPLSILPWLVYCRSQCGQSESRLWPRLLSFYFNGWAKCPVWFGELSPFRFGEIFCADCSFGFSISLSVVGYAFRIYLCRVKVDMMNITLNLWRRARKYSWSWNRFYAKYFQLYILFMIMLTEWKGRREKFYFRKLFCVSQCVRIRLYI